MGRGAGRGAWGGVSAVVVVRAWVGGVEEEEGSMSMASAVVLGLGSGFRVSGALPFSSDGAGAEVLLFWSSAEVVTALGDLFSFSLPPMPLSSLLCRLRRVSSTQRPAVAAATLGSAIPARKLTTDMTGLSAWLKGMRWWSRRPKDS